MSTLQVGEFDVLMCGGGYDRVGIRLDIVESLTDVMDYLRDLYVFCGA